MIESRLIVQKTRYVIDMCQRLTLSQSKMVDCYLARIQSRDPDTRHVEITMRELEEMWRVSELKPAEVRKHIAALLSDAQVVRGDVRGKEPVTQVNFFAEALSYKDTAGKWIVRLACTAEAMPYIFHIEDLGYVRYELKDAMHFRNKYSYLMFLYILRNAFRRNWVVPLGKLREQLACTGVERYQEFKHFNNEILKRSHEDMISSGVIIYQYNLIRKGRAYESVEFQVIKVLGQIARKHALDRDKLLANPLLSFSTIAGDLLNEREVAEIVAQIGRIGIKDHGKQLAYFDDLIARISAQPSVKYKARYMQKMIEYDFLEGKADEYKERGQ